MDFLLRVVLPFVVGGVYVAGIIWLSARLGARIGGIIAGLPSAILVSLVFISFSEGPAVARVAVAVVPLMFVVTLLYATIYLWLVSNVRRGAQGAWPVVVASLVWVVVALGCLRALRDVNYWLVVVLAAAGLAGFWYAFRGFHTIASSGAASSRYTYTMRFVVGGSLVAAALIVAHVLGPEWAGIVGSFPVSLGTALYFLNKSQGSAFLRGFLRNLLIGYTGSLLFMVVVHETLTRLPWAWSFVLGIIAALLVIVPLTLTTKKT